MTHLMASDAELTDQMFTDVFTSLNNNITLCNKMVTTSEPNDKYIRLIRLFNTQKQLLIQDYLDHKEK